MKHRIVILSFLILTGCSTDEVSQTFDCSMLVGRWTGIAESQKWEVKNTYIEQYLPRGVFRAYYKSENNDGVSSFQAEHRTWFCDGKTFGTFLVSTSNEITPQDAIASHKVYEFIELTDTTLKYRTVVGNEVGKTYNDTKIP